MTVLSNVPGGGEASVEDHMPFRRWNTQRGLLLECLLCQNLNEVDLMGIFITLKWAGLFLQLDTGRQGHTYLTAGWEGVTISYTSIQFDVLMGI